MNWPTLIYISTLHLTAILAVLFHTKAAIALFIALYLITGFGITIGYHRYLAHHSFEASQVLLRVFAILGSLAGQGGTLFWVSTHRRHHLFSDRSGDPHNANDGFLWSHAGWTLSSDLNAAKSSDLAKDLSRDPVLRWLDKWNITLQLLLGLGVFVVALIFSDLHGAISAVIWAISVRIVFVLHCTWLTNSAAHRWGYRSFATKDLSRNNAWIALLTLGEGWHNNHHAFPSSAQHGLLWYEFDLSWLVIKLLSSLKLVKQVRVATLPYRME